MIVVYFTQSTLISLTYQLEAALQLYAAQQGQKEMMPIEEISFFLSSDDFTAETELLPIFDM